MQGMVSQGDVELSVISKNFFFLFVNFFVIFTALGTAALSSWDKFGEGSLRDTTMGLATSLAGLRKFYVNYIILQGLGLFPFRLLEFGSIAIYPIFLMGAKTPRGEPTKPTYVHPSLILLQITPSLSSRQYSATASTFLRPS